MKTGDVAKQFGTSTRTINRYVEEFSEHFSDSARRIDRHQSAFTKSDFLTLATIHRLSREGLEYRHIRERLDSGYLVDDVDVETIGYSDGRMIPAVAVEQMIDAAEIRTALAQVQSERNSLLVRLELETESKKELQARIDSMQKTMDDLRERAVKAEAISAMLQDRLSNQNSL